MHLKKDYKNLLSKVCITKDDTSLDSYSFVLYLQSLSDQTPSQQDFSDSDDSEKDEVKDPNFSMGRSRSTSKSRLNLSADPNILAQLDRTGASVRGGTRLVATTAGACGYDKDSVTLSKSSLHRNRSKFRSEIGKYKVKVFHE